MELLRKSRILAAIGLSLIQQLSGLGHLKTTPLYLSRDLPVIPMTSEFSDAQSVCVMCRDETTLRMKKLFTVTGRRHGRGMSVYIMPNS